MAEGQRSTKLIGAAREAVRKGKTLNDALRRLADALRGDFPGLIRVSVRVLRPDGVSLVVAGVWSAGSTRIGEGLVLRILATSMPEIAAGRALVGRLNSNNPALDDVLRSEGVWSWVSIPLAGETRAILSLSSGNFTDFKAEDEPFFSELGRSVEDRLIELSRKKRRGRTRGSD
jgi:hypothetical protein